MASCTTRSSFARLLFLVALVLFTTIGSGSAPSGVETGHWTYTYNPANQLTRWTKHAGASAGVGVGPLLTGASFTYDKSGNRIRRVVDGTTAVAARTTTYTWDTWNRLQKVVVPVTATAKRTWTYTYDHRMRRTSIHQTGNGLKTHHTAVVFSGGLSVAEFTRSSNAALKATTLPAVRYLRGPDMGGGVGGLLGTLRHPVNTSEIPVAPTATKPVRERYNLSNGRGDIVAQSDQSATLTWTASYEAYGKRTRETGHNSDRQRANTKDEDPTGLLNEGFRYRCIETGVWLSRDPAGFVDGPNLYAYVQQNPWTGWDPLGLETKKELRQQISTLNRQSRRSLGEKGADRKKKDEIRGKISGLEDRIANIDSVTEWHNKNANELGMTDSVWDSEKVDDSSSRFTDSAKNRSDYNFWVGVEIVGGLFMGGRTGTKASPNLSKIEAEMMRVRQLAFDPAVKKLRQAELSAATRLEKEFGMKLTRDKSGRGDWVGGDGLVYDAVGSVPASKLQHLDMGKLQMSIQDHLWKEGVDRVVVDMTSFSPSHVSQVQKFMSGLPSNEASRIVTLDSMAR